LMAAIHLKIQYLSDILCCNLRRKLHKVKLKLISKFENPR
jgi:hypothetical protein